MKIGLKELRLKFEDPAHLRSSSNVSFAMACMFLVLFILSISVRRSEPTFGDDAMRFLLALIFFVLGFSARGAARIYERIIALEKSQEELRRSQAERP